MSDLIDRQAILKHIEKIRQGVQMMDDTHRASIIMNGMHLCEEAVRNQSSAQPEIIRCKDCKWYGRADKRRFYRGMDCLNHRIDTIVPDKDYCSRAERRTDVTLNRC